MRDFRYERRLMRRRRPRRPLLMVLTGAVALLVISFIIGALLAVSGGEHAPVMSGSDRARVEEEVRQVRAEVEKLRRAARAGERRPFHLVVSDEQINFLLAEDEKVREQLAAHRVEEAWVHMANGAVVATAVRVVGGMSIQVRAVLVPEVAGDRSIRMRVTEMHIGRLGAPRAAVERLADQISRLVTKQIVDTHVRLTNVRVEGNAVHLVGTTGST